MLTTFAPRFVIAVFGGALLGLLVGVVGKHLFDADWSIWAVMPWGIMAGALGLAFAYTSHPDWLTRQRTRGSSEDTSAG